MLYLVLILVIAAFVLLITALATANTVWAWVSVGISVVAAGLLVYDWLRGRRRVAATSAPRQAEPVAIEDEPEPIKEPAEEPAEEKVAEAPAVDRAGGEEPDEEATDATDLLVISDLADEVRVVDEHPRYHLARCTWLHDKPTIPLAVSEARELGFTPCAWCGPDAMLAARHRAGRGASQ